NSSLKYPSFSAPKGFTERIIPVGSTMKYMVGLFSKTAFHCSSLSRSAAASARLLSVISRVLGIHLTGLDDLSPRAIRRRSLQAGRMSALSRRLGRNSLWALAHNKVL